MTAESWLREKAGDGPENLLDLMLDALGKARSDVLPDRLAEAAILLYARVVEGEGGRADALPLLAADALFTYAFQALAEGGTGDLHEFADRWTGVEGLARLAS